MKVLQLTVARQERGWSKAALARAAKLDQSLVSKIEAARVVPYRPELERLAAALGWPIDTADELMQWVGGPASNDNEPPGKEAA